jgi:ribulose-5-phosphate 4-epimerase/fuculose-1-phosphate aldolase
VSEIDLHILIYQPGPDFCAIVHLHSSIVYACALACCRIPLPPAHYAVCELSHDASWHLPRHEEVNCSTNHARYAKVRFQDLISLSTSRLVWFLECDTRLIVALRTL